MITSLAFILLFGFLIKILFNFFNFPELLGMLFFGMLIGPSCLDLIDPSLMNISGDLRTIALIIILLRAGLGISRKSLKNVGLASFKMSFIPGVLEGLAVALLAQKLLGFSFVEGGILGFILAAVSPAVVVPSMLKLMDQGLGVEKDIPTLIITSASIDDVFAITIFTSFLGLYFNKGTSLGLQLLNIPLSIFFGGLIGLCLGLVLVYILKRLKPNDMSVLVFSTALLLSQLDSFFSGRIKVASLLTIMVLGFIIREKSYENSLILTKSFNGAWNLAQVFLFTLIGAEVNIPLALKASGLGLVILAFGLLARSIGVLISIKGLDYNLKEKTFCIIAYLPKATVQAAIGGIPLSLGLPVGDLILSLAVLSILVTAPLGAFLIDYSSSKLLKKSS